MSAENKSEFEKAGAAKPTNLVQEFLAMLGQNKKFWLVPVIIVLLLFGVIIALSSTAAAPFIYTLF
jgi:hypothetical protein